MVEINGEIMNRVKGKVTIITGGGRNIGRSISLVMAREGAIVCVLDIDTKTGKETVNLIENKGGEAYFIESDVTNVEQINKIVNEVIKRYGKIDILVNNVGGSTGLTLEDIDEKTFQKNIESNLKSAIFCTKAVMPYMIKQNRGSIVYISSINALLGGFSEVGYASAKSGLHSLVMTLTADYSRHGIRFNVVCPGSIPGNSEVWKAREKNKKGMLKKLSRIYPLGRFGEPIDVAYAVLFLASDEANWITGIILPVDGGITATGRLPGGKWWESI